MQNYEVTKQKEEITKDFSKLVSDMIINNDNKSVGDVEVFLLKSLFALGLKLLFLFVLSKQKKIEKTFAKGMDKSRYQNKGRKNCLYQSIFGKLNIVRQSYYDHQNSCSYYVLDDKLGFPKEKMSYLLQSWLTSLSTEMDYRQSSSFINKIFGLSIKENESRRKIEDWSLKVESFYEQFPEPTLGSNQIVTIQHDGKGVPIVKKERVTKTETTPRLGRGQKNGVKKMATVTVISDLTPNVRPPKQVTNSLMCIEKTSATNPNPTEQKGWHQNIHRRAFLGCQREAIEYGCQKVKERISKHNNPIVALVDGGPGLEEGLKEVYQAQGLTISAIILDIIHVSEYLWKAANALLGEKSKERNAWVAVRLEKILKGEVAELTQELTLLAETDTLKDSQKETILKTIQYYTNHKHKMDYKTYLEKGYPISTALAESTCGHLVKDRMEHSGMRWSSKGAQSMLDCRAVQKNGDWDEFVGFYTNQKLGHIRSAA